MIPHSVLQAYNMLDAKVSALGTGLINDTFLVVEHPKLKGAAKTSIVMQRLHPIFDGGVNTDLDVVTRHLAQQGLTTPLLVRTQKNEQFVDDDDDRMWRALSFVDGKATDVLQDSEHAFEAGKLVAHFHNAISTLPHDIYEKKSRAVHDTQRHLKALVSTLLEYGVTEKTNPFFAEVQSISTPLLMDAALLPDISRTPLRHAHGDLKVSNLLFDDDRKSVCLVDLDTLYPMCWAHEMGDALRSWCNPAGEDADEVLFSTSFFEAAMEGYFSESGIRDVITAEERSFLVDGVATICLELCARFLTDTLEGNYFGWDEKRFPNRNAHNLHRAKGQWALYLDVKRKSHELKEFMGIL
ncbi:MAG: aminoglycoside phosphotransferase family protein [Deltaproteobacteria bacterium]|nr:aminoglycoside phosphotransferase family protein [Deltaproteobacteria bacterium]